MKLKNVLPIVAMLLVVFFSGCKKEDENPGVNPTVTSTVPVNQATSISINSMVSANFSVAMNPSTMTLANFTLQHGTETVSGVVEYTGKTTTFTPSENLVSNTIYTATITTGAKDIAGNYIEKNYVWTFTTGAILDITLPTVTLTEPLNNATGVALNKAIAITFSEAMDPLTINSNTFTLNQGTNAISGLVSYSGTTATFTPTNTLVAGTTYTATITTGAKDLAGNALAVNTVLSFTTIANSDITLPTVTLTSPLDNATNVERNKVIAITFSETMEPLTINSNTFTLYQGTNAISGSIVYSGITATFTPTNALAASSIYTATITTGAKDLAGNALAINTVLSFTTNSTISNLAVVELGSAGNYVILAKTAITNISTSAITGDLGLSPAATSYITGLSLTDATGYAISAQVTGSIFAADMADPTPINLTTAVNNMITAYNDAAGRSNPDFLELSTGNIGGKTLTAGLYKWTNTVTLPSDVTISGGANDVWIFQISGDLLMSNAVNVTLIGGAQAKNIFWQVAGQATFGTTSHFEGVILSMTGITFQTGATLNGRALAQTAVALDGNAITKP
ncbi:MAG: DUF3494 domain-containing protein [Bacteroidales bacterium]|nr:DUF3494 domain-containing protein [Bacteroidales bacterium]